MANNKSRMCRWQDQPTQDTKTAFSQCSGIASAELRTSVMDCLELLLIENQSSRRNAHVPRWWICAWYLPSGCSSWMVVTLLSSMVSTSLDKKMYASGGYDSLQQPKIFLSFLNMKATSTDLSLLYRSVSSLMICQSRVWYVWWHTYVPNKTKN